MCGCKELKYFHFFHCYSLFFFVIAAMSSLLEPFLFLLVGSTLSMVTFSCFCAPILAHLTVFLSFPVGQLPSIATRVCTGGVSTVFCRAIILSHTGFQSCMNRYLILLEHHQWTAIFISFCFTSCS